MKKMVCALCLGLGIAFLAQPALAWHPAGDTHRELLNELSVSIEKASDYPSDAERQIEWYKRYRARAIKVSNDSRADMVCVLKAVGSQDMAVEVFKQEAALQEMQKLFLRGPAGKKTTRLDREAYGLEWELHMADYYIVIMLTLPEHPGCDTRGYPGKQRRP